MFGGEGLGEHVLGTIGILVFIHQEVAEPVLVFLPDIGFFTQQFLNRAVKIGHRERRSDPWQEQDAQNKKSSKRYACSRHKT